MNDFEALVLLNMIPGIGPLRLKKLVGLFGPAARIFRRTLHELSSCGILTPLMARAVKTAPEKHNVDAEIQEACREDIKILTLFDGEYPALLKEIHDPPFVLYVKGGFIPADENSVGMVGSRGASYYGLTSAAHFAAALCRAGVTVVSGLARGIDTASHRAALETGGRTIAVLGSGLLCIYPPENEGLFHEIARQGAVVSQFPLRAAPLAQNFPMRNRIISGLSRGVVVVEASLKSGALITARCALEQGREVFAIPGKVSSGTSAGANDLIKQGARLVTAPEEILEDLKENFTFKNAPAEPAAPKAKEGLSAYLSLQERSVVEKLSDEPKYIDEICAETGFCVSEIMALLMRLEVKGAVRQLPGKNFVIRTNCS